MPRSRSRKSRTHSRRRNSRKNSSKRRNSRRRSRKSSSRKSGGGFGKSKVQKCKTWENTMTNIVKEGNKPGTSNDMKYRFEDEYDNIKEKYDNNGCKNIIDTAKAEVVQSPATNAAKGQSAKGQPKKGKGSKLVKFIRGQKMVSAARTAVKNLSRLRKGGKSRRRSSRKSSSRRRSKKSRRRSRK